MPPSARRLPRTPDTTPERLRPFLKLGLAYGFTSGEEAVCDCPFCGKEAKFYLNLETGLWSCKAGHCGLSGNLTTFLQKWWESAIPPTQAQWEELSQDRSLPVEALQDAGLVYDSFGGRWALPVRNRKGSIVNFRFYKPGGKMQGLPGVDTYLYGIEGLGSPDLKTRIRRVYLSEGEWDALALRLMIREDSVLGTMDDVAVISVPGASIFKDGWAEQFAGIEEVVLCYDNDEDGFKKGHKRAAEKLRNAVGKVFEVRWVEGLPEHFDIRDFYRFSGDMAKLAEMVFPYEDAEIRRQREEEEPETPRPPFTSPERPSFQKILDVYNRYLKMTPDMEMALRVIYATILMNDIQGEPLWIHIVSPPGTGKTELLMSASEVSSVTCASRLSPHSLVSGFKMPGGEDPSLMPKIIGKTFVLKDFTEVLQMPKMVKEDIFGTLRGAYDGEVSKPFGHGIVREYKGRFNMLTGVTHAIFSEQSANMGERFLNFHLVKGVGFDANETIYAALANVGAEDRMQHDLREAACSFLEYKVCEEDLPKVPDEYIRRVVGICQVVAMLRANVEKDSQDRLSHRPQHEMGTRIGKQLMKLIMGLGLLNNPPHVGDYEYSTIARVALDSCIGFNLEVVRTVFFHPRLTAAELAEKTEIPATTLREQLENLTLLGVLVREKEENPAGRGAPVVRYSITQVFKKHWCEAELDQVVASVPRKPRVRLKHKRRADSVVTE